MSTILNAVRKTLLGGSLSMLLAFPAFADDAEIFVSDANAVGARPNVLFILDTSGSMNSCVPAPGSGSNGRPCTGGRPSRLQIVRDVAINLANSLTNVNLGLMRYSSDAQGGYILAPVANIDDNRADIVSTLQDFRDYDGGGNTPLSETLYEAALYLKGDTWDYGSHSNPKHSVDESLNSHGSNATYKSPIEFQCQKNYIVYLTDGLPTADNDANNKIQTMIGKTCSLPDTPEVGQPVGSGRCTDELAGWMADANTDLAPSTNGNQNALTYMVGFGGDVDNSIDYLNAIASAGGTGAAYTAADQASLTTALETIFKDVENRSQTFTTPSIAVNSFNRTQTGADLFFTLFKVEDTEHWNGNLKKYKLSGSTIVDATGAPAVSNGFFAAGSTSFWSPTQDGSDVTAGGAVSQQDTPARRNIYTNLVSPDLSAAGNAVSAANAGLTPAAMGLAPADVAGATVAINFARGYITGDPLVPLKPFMGDPLHGQPGIVTYGQIGGKPDQVVYVPTNDGFLHAIVGEDQTGAPGTQSGGQELWAFIPQQKLARLKDLASTLAHDHTYGLDGDVQVLKYDANGDGTVNGSDFVWIFFGMRMGGTHYYALDVTNRDRPKLLWDISPPGGGQSWSTPVITKVNVSGGNVEPNKYVLIFGGGYDTRNEAAQGSGNDAVGNRIFMVDAKTGTTLWSAGPAGADTNIPQMRNSISSRIGVFDIDGDGFSDRMYVGDLGGRVFRFDIYNGAARAGLVAGGLFADLGARGAAGVTTDNRRFYNAPDVALFESRGVAPYFNIAIGSGYRGHPLNTVTQEHFYSLRDKAPFARYTQLQYNSAAAAPITEATLVDITNDANPMVAPSAAGWWFNMSGRAGHSGEKVLAEATTVNNIILITTFQPGATSAPSANNPCYPVNTNRVYALGVASGECTLDFNGDGTPECATNLNQTGIVGQVNVGILQQLTDSDGDGVPDAEEDNDHNGIADCLEGKGTNCTSNVLPTCMAGLEVLGACPPMGNAVRTYWRRDIN